MYDTVIIGAGPAGLTAAIYLRRNNKKVLLLEKNAPGGKVITTYEVENYPGAKKQSGVELAMAMYEQAMSFNVEFKMETVTNIQKAKTFKVITNKNNYEAKTVILATGMKNRLLNVKGENEYLNHGISFCAICDGTFHKDKDVVVIGGGNSALEEAVYLASIAKSVTIVQNLDYFTGDEKAIVLAKENPKITMLTGETVVEFKGENEELTHVKLASGKTLKASGAFIYIGFLPETDLYKELGISNAFGFIETDKNMETKVRGLYAAGDTVSKDVRQIVTATSDGAVAALSIIRDRL